MSSEKVKSTAIRDLRKVLAQLYTNETSIRRVCEDSAIDISTIQFSGRAIDDWYSAWQEAEKSSRINHLLNEINTEYGGNQEFQLAVKNYLSTRTTDFLPQKTLNQRGSVTIFGTLITALLLVGFAGGLGMLFYNRISPKCHSLRVCILVARIAPEGDAAAQQFSKILYDEISNALDDSTIDIVQVPALEQMKSAKELAEQEKANLVISGAVYKNYTEPMLRIDFTLADLLGITASTNVRSERMAPYDYQSIDQEIECNNCSIEDVHDMAIAKAKIVAFTAVGLANYAQGDPEEAALNFELALYCAGEDIEIVLNKQDIKCSLQKQHKDWNPGLLWYYLGKSLILQGNYERGIAYLSNAAHLNSKDPAALITIAEAYQHWLAQAHAPIVLEYLQSAQIRLTKLLTSSLTLSTQNSLIYDAGIMYELQEDYGNAAQYYADVVTGLGENNSRSYVSLVNLGRVQRLAKKMNDAEVTLLKALQLVKDSPWAYLELARLYQTMNREADADAMLTQSKQWSGNAYVHITQAEICQQRWQNSHFSMNENYICVVKAYNQALTLRPFSGWLNSQVGDFYLPTDPPIYGQSWELAKEYYSKAKRLRVKDPWIYEKYAYVQLNLGNYQEAAESYQKVIDLSYSGDVLWSLYCAKGEAQKDDNKLPEAKMSYQKCLEMAPQPADKKYAADLLSKINKLQEISPQNR